MRFWLVVGGSGLMVLLLGGLTLAVIVEHGIDMLTLIALVLVVVLGVGVGGPLLESFRTRNGDRSEGGR